MFSTKDLVRTKTRDELIEAFFSKKMKWSYSSLTKLLFSPRAFFKEYVLKEKDKDNARHFSEGTLIHALLLEPDVLPDKYKIQPLAVPKDNQLLVVQAAYASYLDNPGVESKHSMECFDLAILSKMLELKYYQQLKTDQQRLDKVLTPENIAYFEFLKEATGKELISEDTYVYCKKAADYVKENQKCAMLLGLFPEFLGNSEIINEQFIEIDPTEEEDGLKGFLDNLHIDHDRKIIYVNDVKTTAKGLDRFYRTVLDYLYSIQMAIYVKLVKYKYAELITDDYEIKAHFIVVDSALQVYAFPVKDETLDRWTTELNQALSKANWHLTTRSFALPYSYERNMVEL